MTSGIWTNVWWFLFGPGAIYDLTFLEPMSRDVDETPVDFAKRVQVATAAVLGVEATNFSFRDKKQLVLSHE